MHSPFAISEDFVTPKAARIRWAYRARTLTGWWVTTLLLSVAVPTASACRYNVRDVGFMDLDSEQYRLQVFIGPSTSPLMISRLKSAAETALQGSNVRLEMVDLETLGPNASRESFPSSTTPWPALALLSPEGQTLRLPSVSDTTEANPAWETILDSLVVSPTRDRLLESVSQTFAAILLLDGTDTAANEKARATIDEAIEQTRAQMRTLPKAIARPPELVRLDLASLVRETTLLWSLSLKPEPTVHPRALVLYGRLRWIGPVMNGMEITARNLVGLLSMIGADCECGLDLQWTLGTRVPARWSDRIHAQATKGLGFDPENPLVKTEIAAIVERRRSDTGPRLRTSETTDSPKTIKSEHEPESLDRTAQTSAQFATSSPTSEADLPTPLAWVALSAIAGFVIIASAILIRRARRQR